MSAGSQAQRAIPSSEPTGTICRILWAAALVPAMRETWRVSAPQCSGLPYHMPRSKIGKIVLCINEKTNSNSKGGGCYPRGEHVVPCAVPEPHLVSFQPPSLLLLGAASVVGNVPESDWMHRLPLTLVIKILLASTLLFSDGVFSLGGVEHQRLPRLVKAVKPAVVTVDVFDSSKSFLETGSGFFVTPDLIVSSRHVLWKSRGVGEKPREPRRAAHFAQAKTNDRLAPNEYNLRAVLLDDRESDIIVLQVCI